MCLCVRADSLHFTFSFKTQILQSMREQVSQGNVATLESVKKFKEAEPPTEEELMAAGDEPGHIMGEGADGSDIAGLIVEEAARSATALQLVERMPFLAAAYDRYGDRLASNGKAGGLPDTIRADEKARIECQATGQGLLLLANIDAEPAQTGMRRLALLIERDHVLGYLSAHNLPFQEEWLKPAPAKSAFWEVGRRRSLGRLKQSCLSKSIVMIS